MRIPDVIFNEQPALGAPINLTASNRIAIVGEFTRGPINTVLLSDFKDFARIYGYDNGIANLAFQAAYDQGAREFGVTRVIGSSEPAKVNLLIGGTATKSNILTLNLKFIGQPISSTYIETPIASTGSYTGTADKRYVYNVTHGPVSALAVYNQSSSATTITFNPADAKKIVVGSTIISNTAGVLPANTTVTNVNTTTGVVTLSASLLTGAAGYNVFTTSNKAILKWVTLGVDQYPNRNVLPSINWGTTQTDVPSYVDTTNTTVTGGLLSTALDLTTDAGIYKITAEGVSLKFSTTGVPIELYPGDQFTVRVSSTQYNVPIAESATPSDVINNIQDLVSGVNPIGQVTRLTNEQGAGLFLAESIFNQPIEFFDLNDPDRITIASGYSFWIDLETPDGQVVTTGTAANNSTTLTVADASNISINSIVSHASIPQGAVVQSKSGNVLTLSQATTSAITNESITFSNIDGISFSNYGVTNKTGFSSTTNSARNAFRTLYSSDGQPLVRFTAISPGQWGNNIALTVNSTGASRFNVVIEDKNTNTLDTQIESFDVDLLTDVDGSGNINSITSTYLKADYLPVTLNQPNALTLLNRTPQRLAPANVYITDINDIRHINYVGNARLKNIFLIKGYDGPVPVERDYIKTINSLSEQLVNFIVVASELAGASDAIKQAQITVANNSKELEGRKIAILTSKRNLTPALARIETAAINTERAVYVAGWATYGGDINNRFGVPLSAFYAGKLASLPENISPHARTSAGSIQGIISTDLDQYKSLATKQQFIDAKVDMISLDTALSGYYVVQGRTLTNTAGKDRINIVRVNDTIRKDLYFNLQAYKGENNSRKVRNMIASSISAYMSSMARSGYIVSYSQPVIDESNNSTTDYYNGNLNINLSYTPLYPIDRIEITLTRDVSGTVTLA
jgi:hypothetical protein